jgi:hypothetical protein
LVPQARSLWYHKHRALRASMGFCRGAAMPTASAMVGLRTSERRRASAYSLMASALSRHPAAALRLGVVGLAASLADTVLGATLQAVYVCQDSAPKTSACARERGAGADPGVRPAAGNQRHGQSVCRAGRRPDSLPDVRRRHRDTGREASLSPRVPVARCCPQRRRSGSAPVLGVRYCISPRQSILSCPSPPRCSAQRAL